MADKKQLLEIKHVYLKELLKESHGCAIAYSGGIDSTFLTRTAFDVLDGHCMAVIADSPVFPRNDFNDAVAWLKQMHIPYQVVKTGEYKLPAFKRNPPERCYYCKTELFKKIRKAASQHGYSCIVEGSNTDDQDDFRPGRKALNQQGILSPMIQAGLTKSEIRLLAKNVYQLPMHNKPAGACLASRFQYGTEITEERLAKIEAIELFLKSCDFIIVRARYHKDLIRLELGPDEMDRLMDCGLRQACISFIKKQGFQYITLDLQGFRSGSSNEVLRQKK